MRQRFYPRARWCVADARAFTRQTLGEWKVTDRADDVVLCVSELATNALLHGVPPGRGFQLRLELHQDGTLHAEIHDSGDGTPRVPYRTDDDEREHGRGLRLVEALSDKWGVRDRNPGKIVWCEFTVTG